MGKVLLVTATVLAALALLFSFLAFVSQPSVDEIATAAAKKVTVPTATEIASKVQVTQVVQNNSKLDELYNDYFETEFEEKAQNETAKSLVLSEMKTKDFKKEIMSVLNENNQSVEEYQDITEIYSISIEEVELDEEDATVTVEFKVKFVNNGDAEDESEKAKFTAVFLVSDLDQDDKFEDAEAELDELSLVKVYE